MYLWWLSASDEELRAASTCRQCGNREADIDLGLCFYCFSQNSEEHAAIEKEARAAEDEYYRQLESDAS